MSFKESPTPRHLAVNRHIRSRLGRSPLPLSKLSLILRQILRRESKGEGPAGDAGPAASPARRVLHGKFGRGRFRAFALGDVVTWRSVYDGDGKRYSFGIRGTSTAHGTAP